MNVFELIKEKLANQVYMIRDTYSLGNDCTEDYIGAFEEIIDEVAKEYNNGWIPCSERFPSDCAIHEVTAQFSNGKIYTEFAYYDESKAEWWKFDDDGLVNVLAWKEHSEPYKEGGTE